MNAEAELLFRGKSPGPNACWPMALPAGKEVLCCKKRCWKDSFACACKSMRPTASPMKCWMAKRGSHMRWAKVPGAVGAFVGEVRGACLAVLREVAEQCFAPAPYRQPQTLRMLDFLQEQCGVQPEYPWVDEPAYAVFRHQGNRKWFAVLMRIEGRRLDSAFSEEVEVLNLKAPPAKITAWVERGECYRGYHMNKLHWHTTVLDGHLSDETLLSRITESFLMTK